MDNLEYLKQISQSNRPVAKRKAIGDVDGFDYKDCSLRGGTIFLVDGGGATGWQFGRENFNFDKTIIYANSVGEYGFFSIYTDSKVVAVESDWNISSGSINEFVESIIDVHYKS